MQEKIKIRIDKYLWSIRVFKTRSLAAEACSKGKVICNTQTVKPSYTVKIGETYRVKITTDYTRIIEVIQLIDKRGSAKLVKDYFIDHSPPYERKKTEQDAFFSPNISRLKGSGRPTKKDRRSIQEKFNHID